MNVCACEVRRMKCNKQSQPNMCRRSKDKSNQSIVNPIAASPTATRPIAGLIFNGAELVDVALAACTSGSPEVTFLYLRVQITSAKATCQMKRKAHGKDAFVFVSRYRSDVGIFEHWPIGLSVRAGVKLIAAWSV